MVCLAVSLPKAIHMKKAIYTITSLLFASAGFSQTLTRAANEPTVGDVYTRVNYDTVSAIPRNTGLNQVWNFSSMIQSTDVVSTSFEALSSVTISTSQFSTATLAENDGSGGYTFYKSVTTPSAQLEIVGYGDGMITQTYTNTLIQAIWPFNYGSIFMDTFSGSITGTNVSGSFSGTNTVTGSGSGTLMLPGGINLSNVLQAKVNTILKMSTTYSSIPITITLNATSYNYYHTSKKFQIASVNVDITQSAFGDDTTITVNINKDVAVGLTEKNFDAPFAIYPNPAKNNFTVKLSNTDSQPCKLQVFDGTGKLVKTIDYGTAAIINDNVDISALPRGVYLVKTNLGEKLSVRRLVVE